MDYEKAYKAVLQTAKQWIKDGCTDKEKICLECVFPELRESEDEKVRQWLVDYFGSIKETVWIHRDITCEQILAYLEKQKELPFVKDVMLGYPGLYFYDGERMHFRGPAMEEEQKEQKPVEIHIDNPNIQKVDPDIKISTNDSSADGKELLYVSNKSYDIGFRDGVASIKQEWSEEEKDYYDTIVRKLEVIGDDCGLSDNQIKFLREHCPSHRSKWSEEDIKKIRSEEYTKGFNDAAFVSKLKEWSVEDEDRIRQIERIAQEAGCTQKLQEEIHDWLKSLRSRPSWKPSEEQMFTHHEADESLEEAVTHQMEDDGNVDDFVRRGIDNIALRYAELGAKWYEEQFERNRLAHCDALSKEDYDRETDFAMEIIEKEHRQPTFLDAINYGMRLQEKQMGEQARQALAKTDITLADLVAFDEGCTIGRRLERQDMMKGAVEGKVYFQMGNIMRVQSDDFENPDIHLGDKVKLIIVKED